MVGPVNVAGYLHLINGPGEGHRFYVQRAPLYIRIVRSIEGKWDVLDLLEDEPTSQEEIYVYKQLGWMHVRAQTRKESGYYYDYVHIPIDGVKKATLRYTDRWQQWATLIGEEDRRRERAA